MFAIKQDYPCDISQNQKLKTLWPARRIYNLASIGILFPHFQLDCTVTIYRFTAGVLIMITPFLVLS